MSKTDPNVAWRRTGACLAAAAFAVSTVGIGAAQTGPAPIPSDTPDALEIPELWDCSRIEPEYRDWLDAGNTPDSWKYVGKIYRDVEDGDLYNWQDWLDWADDAGCLPGGLTNTTPGVPAPGLIVAGVVTALGVGVVAGSGGSGNKSPG
ncbi:hypothetical protein [Qipengyuania flava]|uniref:hypothetical protein n=1 Tax=Qipengyuania flava TaxID=192812 RepID=UPI001C63AF50|nr:hypothetical protein [Qipengyuania flava]QYJ06883.1 hypothetical protein KUV82_12660 [Qipengyuania flava]